MRDPKKFALSSACSWLNKCYDLGMTAEEIVAQSVARRVQTFKRKENKKGKEKFPPHPLIEKGEEQEKAAAAAAACARACEGANGNPSYEQVEKYASVEGISQIFAKAWYDRMNRDNDFKRWLYPSSGKKLNNWRRYLAVCWKRRDEFDPYEPAKEERPKLDFIPTALRAL